MLFKLRIGLPLKFVLSISVVILLTSLSLTWFFVKNQIVQIRATLEDRCTILARNLANSSEFGVITRNKDFLQKLNDIVVNEEEDVVYSIIYDKDGKLLVFNEKRATRDLYKELEPLINYKMRVAIKKDLPYENQHVKDVIKLTYDSKTGQTVHDTICPILIVKESLEGDEQLINGYRKSSGKEELIGFARVGISLSRMQKQISDTKFGVLVLTSIVVLIGILLSVFLVRIIVKPIEQLSIGTRKLASGDLNYHVSVQSNDEIGELAESFNAMASDLRKYVRELRKEKEDLLATKGTLEQRTKELEETLVKMKNIQQELLRSEKFASVGRLSSSIAHELRNPLASLKNISYYLTKLGTYKTDVKANQMLELLSTDVARANKIVTDLLDFARIKKITRSPVKLDEFINKFLDSMDFGEDIHIIRDLESVDASIDPDKMSQVLLNLFSNSRDAMPKGGNITITARKNNNTAVIRITDTGHGMDEETIEHIFDPLFSTKTRGLGLSLAIVKEIIDLHNGVITVLSSKGKGTSFDINLPLE